MRSVKQAKKCGSRSRLLIEYEQFLREQQCLAPTTVAIRRKNVTSFLSSLKERASPSKISSLAAHTVHDYIIKTSRPLQRASRKHLVSSLRSFLRFAHVRGYLEKSLVDAVPLIATWKLEGIPRTIPWTSVQKLLSAPDRKTHGGRRDYAILQLLASYGVRIGQVTGLCLSDIKWHEGVIHFSSSKGGKPLCFPLTRRVAAALMTYLRQDRREHSFPQVFLTVRKPIKPMSQRNHLGPSLRIYFQRAGIDSKIRGSYVIRHAFATRLMEKEVPVKTIADLLGHRSINTTFIYTKVDIKHLRTLVRDWPEVRS
ncbi:MAG: tyrosine-type recombinase/integrase [Acidobacteria bacterium]|nr:tyrosine-type recombinase/integrase [Acidobacteriota bacterium]